MRGFVCPRCGRHCSIHRNRCYFYAIHRIAGKVKSHYLGKRIPNTSQFAVLKKAWTRVFLSVLDEPGCEMFYKLLKFYVKGSLILDPCCGERVLYQHAEKDPAFEFVFGDAKRLNGLSYVGSVACLPFRDKTFDAVCVDLPYPSSQKELGEHARKFYGSVDLERYLSLAKEAVKEAYRALKEEGVLIFKTVDVWEGTRLRLLHADIAKMMEEAGLKLADMVIWRFWAYRRYLQKFKDRAYRIHQYFLIAKK